MTISTSDLRSKMAKVKGLGSAHHGVSHWWWQRVTALAMVPLTLWFMGSLVSAMLSPDVIKVAEWFASPFNTAMMVLLIVAAFWHAKLGLQVVIEDYVHGTWSKYAMLLGNVFLCVVLGLVSVLAVLKMHLLDILSGGIL